MQKLVALISWSLIGGLVALFLMTSLISNPAFSEKKSPTTVTAVKKSENKSPHRAEKKKAESTLSKQERRELPPLLVGLYIFVLAIFVGFELISKVPPILHTPLMSGANAISGITIVGALFCARASVPSIPAILGLIAVIAAMINVVGGFLVTDRMLQMFKK